MRSLRIEDLPSVDLVGDEELDLLVGGMPPPEEPNTGCIYPDWVRF